MKIHQTDDISGLVRSTLRDDINGLLTAVLDSCSISINEELFNWLSEDEGDGWVVGVYCCCWKRWPSLVRFFKRFLICLYRQQSKQGAVKIRNGIAIRNKRIKPIKMPTIVRRWKNNDAREWPSLKKRNPIFSHKRSRFYRFRQGPRSKCKRKKSF